MQEPAPEQIEPATAATPPDFDGLADLIRQAESLWEIGRAAGGPPSRLAPKDLVREAVQRAAAPVHARQMQFNAVLVRALYWLMTESQRASARAERRADELQDRLSALERQLADTRGLLRQALPELYDRLAEEERATTLLAQAQARLDVEERA